VSTNARGDHAHQPRRALGRKPPANVEHPGWRQPNLGRDRPVSQPALPQPNDLPPALLLSRGRQLAHVHVLHADQAGANQDPFKTMRARSIGTDRASCRHKCLLAAILVPDSVSLSRTLQRRKRSLDGSSLA
jgi:hypothetical protein